MDPTYPKDHPVEHTIEECAELIQALQKAKRFGWDNYKPRDTRSNRLLVIMEIRDVEDSLITLRNFMEQNHAQTYFTTKILKTWNPANE